MLHDYKNRSLTSRLFSADDAIKKAFYYPNIELVRNRFLWYFPAKHIFVVNLEVSPGFVYDILPKDLEENTSGNISCRLDDIANVARRMTQVTFKVQKQSDAMYIKLKYHQ